MAEEDRTRRWQRFAPPADPIQAVRAAIAAIRRAPTDPEARRRLHALGAEQWEQLAVLLADEARAADHPAVAAAFYEELADVHENLDQPVETIAAMERVVELDPDHADHHDRLAWLYRRAEAWLQAAAAYERVAELSPNDRGRAALRAAGKLYRERGKLDRAAAIYRRIVERRPSDLDAWRALDELLTELGRWREAAAARGERATRAKGVERAALLRSQARALEQAGEHAQAAQLVAQAQQYAPDDVSGLVDYAEVLAREGHGHKAADILAARIDEAVDRGAPTDDVAALRLRLFDIVDEQLRDRARAQMVMADLLAAAPEYLPALERLAARAARDPDPRAHAAALLRYAAAAPDPTTRGLAFLEAARRYRELGDHDAAIAAFEDAATLVDDPAVRRELDDSRTARTLAGVLARADQLAAAGKLDAAAEQLRDALGDVPADTPGERLAPLVHQLARVLEQLDDDESHQLLHEAHRLDRRSLPIQLALGESCFRRKLWRQAALHLGALADHPHAPRHAAAIAQALVHAAQAEIRALRPHNALAHYATAARLDPQCAAAHHALGEAAMERGDVAEAVDHLEREAQATTDPQHRLRLFDALGDLAHDVLGDPARAEHCWLQIADLADVPTLDKLVTVQRARGTVRGDTSARLAAQVADAGPQRELLEEAAAAYAAAGDLPQATAVAERLMADPVHARTPSAVACAARIALAAGDPRRTARWLERALTAWDADDARRADPAAPVATGGDGPRTAHARGPDEPARAGAGPAGPQRPDRHEHAALWRTLGDARRALGTPDPARAAYRRTVIAAPDSEGALAARRALVELAASVGESAATSRIALVEAEQVPTDVLAWARELARANTTHAADDARLAFDLARALGAVLDEDDARFLAAHPVRPMASDEAYATVLGETELRALVDDADAGPLAPVFDLLAEAAPLVCPTAQAALVDADLLDTTRLAGTSDAAVAAIYPQIAKALGGPATLLHATSDRTRPALALLYATPPVVVVGPALAGVRARSHADLAAAEDRATPADADLRFQLGRLVELSRPRRIFAAQPADAFDVFVRGLRHAFAPAAAPAGDRSVRAAADRIRGATPVALRARLAEWFAGSPDDVTGAAHQARYRAAVDRAADRAGLVACGDVIAALERAGGPDHARHLVQLAAAQRYLAARRKLRPHAVETETTQPFAR